MDNLNFYVNGVPAGQQMDKYSSQPGCLSSKNLDIFSSSKSVKATAFSEPETASQSYIDIDERGNLRLMADGKVYDSEGTLIVDPAVNFPEYNVSYDGTGTDTAPAEFGTPKRLFVRYIGDERVALTIFTTTTQYTYNKTVQDLTKSLYDFSSNLTQEGTMEEFGYDYFYKNKTTSSTSEISYSFDAGVPFSKVKFRISAEEWSGSSTTISLQKIELYKPSLYKYDPETGAIIVDNGLISPRPQVEFTGDIATGIEVEIPYYPQYRSGRQAVVFTVLYTRKEGYTDYGWNGRIRIDYNTPTESSHHVGEGDTHETYIALPLSDREFVDLGEYVFEKSATVQKLYNWSYEWINDNRNKKTLWNYGIYGVWNTDPSMEIISGIVWNTNPYLIGNKGGNGYIIPAPIGGETETPYIAEGITFKGAIPQDYYLYLVGEDRGVSGLYVYSGQQLVKILGGTLKKNEKSLINVEEQYKFSGKMCVYRGNLILGTEDGRLFEYGQTFNGRGGAFIHQVDGDITDIKVVDNNLTVEYTNDNTNYKIIFQGELAEKNYNTEFMAEYPITIGNHILEKEATDLHCSYILPSADCKLEFWAMANHYHFWSFYSTDTYEFTHNDTYLIKGCTGDYGLRFIEKNGNRYTFKLEGDLPVQTTTDMKITDSEGVELINYSEYNHFRRIGIIETDKYKEGEFRFHSINNLLELPKSHSLQILVKGYGTSEHTPELFAVDLVANQRDRG